jgi:hypothetical protein
MGYSISWLAARAPAREVRDLLGLQLTGKQVELPEAPIVGAELDSEWYLVVAARCDHRLIADPSLNLVSKGAGVIACSIEEHVMYSRSSFWSGGSRIWSIEHDAQRSIDHLDVSGQPPSFFVEIRDRLLGQQSAEGGSRAGVDFVFDVPLEVAQRIVGFKHDAAGDPERFDVLQVTRDSVLARARPWWKFWQ